MAVSINYKEQPQTKLVSYIYGLQNIALKLFFFRITYDPKKQTKS